MKSVIIDRLIEIEESARNATKDVQEKEHEYPAKIQSKFKEIDNNLRSDYEKKAEAAKEQKKQEADYKIIDIKSDSVNRNKKLDDYYAQNHVAWEQEIFDRITTGRG